MSTTSSPTKRSSSGSTNEIIKRARPNTPVAGILKAASREHENSLQKSNFILQPQNFSSMTSTPISVLTWNVSSINQNPFEYYVEYGNDSFNNLMKGVDRITGDNVPQEVDVPLSEIFPKTLVDNICQLIRGQGWSGEANVRKLYNSVGNTPVITGILKDKTLGDKRLMSWPDRFTNTVNTDGTMFYRSSPINASLVPHTIEGWWGQWCPHMGLHMDRLKPLKKSRYPALTDEEETHSMAYQLFWLAVFDRIQIHIMDNASTKWRSIKKVLVETFIKNKDVNVAKLLKNVHGDTDIFCLQEVSANTNWVLKQAFSDTHTSVAAPKATWTRGQTSIVMYNKTRFTFEKDVTADVLKLCTDTSVSQDDFVAVQLHDTCNAHSITVASFHGVSTGASTMNIVNALGKYRADDFVVFGLDTNMSFQKGKKATPVSLLYEGDHGFTSCFPLEKLVPTTFSARTAAQPQLQKAVKYSERFTKASREPKDHILTKNGLVKQTTLDNTGTGQHSETAITPGINFPSDHTIVKSVVVLAADC